MKKLLIMLVLTVCTAGLFAQMAKYDRKSISITKMNVSADAKAFATQADVNMIYSELYKRLKGMERFDYNEIPAGITDVNELMKIVKEYTATKIEERAAKQWNIKNEYYGSNFVTGENVDKIMNGAFIMVPTLNSYIITEGKDKEGKQTFTAVMNVKLDVYEGVKNGDAFEAKLNSTVSANGTNASLGIDVSSLLNLPTGKAKDPRKEAIESATNTMLLFLDKEVRKLPMFTIKAFTTTVNPAKDEINFNMGKNVGVKLDDAYQVGFYQGEKFVETGFMKVRKIDQEGSRSQLLIVSNPKGEKESELFNEFDQVIEYPQVGLNIIVGGGIDGYKGIKYDDVKVENNSVVFDEDKNISTLAPSFGVNAQYNVAKFTNISELYLATNANLILAEDWTNVRYELGVTKKFFKRRFGFYVGANFVYNTMDYSGDNDQYGYNGTNASASATAANKAIEKDSKYTSLGANVNAGFNILLGKNAFIDIGAGYVIAGGISNEDGDEVKDFVALKNGYAQILKEENLFNPKGLTVKAGIGFTL